MNLSKKIITLSLIAMLNACSDGNSILTAGKTSFTDKKGSVSVNVINPSKYRQDLGSDFGKFRVKAISPEDVFYGYVSVSGPGISGTISNAVDSNPVRLLNGNNNQVSFQASSVPAGSNRIIKVEGQDRSMGSLGSHVAIMGVTNVIADTSVSANVSWQTTPTAKVIQRLMDIASPLAGTIDYTAVQSLIDTIVNNNTPSDYSDDIHPSLVNASSLADYINSNSGAYPSLANSSEIAAYRLTAQTISGKISGITYSVPGVNLSPVKYIPPTKVICNDPASKIVTVTDKDGNYTISGVTPGTGYTVKVIPEFHTEAKSSGISAGATNVNFSVSKLHYLEHSLGTYGVTHFKSSRPVRVQLITPTNVPDYSASVHRQSVMEALKQWESFAPEVLSFEILPDIADNDPNLVQKKNDADIYIQWTQSFASSAVGVTSPFPTTSSNSMPSNPQSYSINYYSMPYNSGYRAAIALATRASGGVQIGYKSLRAIAAHEMGHALGLAIQSGHPQSYKDDLMYPSINIYEPVNLNINYRDLNTFRFLSIIPPNVTRD